MPDNLSDRQAKRMLAQLRTAEAGQTPTKQESLLIDLTCLLVSANILLMAWVLA